MIRAFAALLAVPALGLSLFNGISCGEYDRASMACCQGDAAGCHQSGKTEDCCRKTPPTGRYAITAEKGPCLGTFFGPWSSSRSLNLITTVAIPPEWLTRTLHVSSLELAPGPSPPSITVLRV